MSNYLTKETWAILAETAKQAKDSQGIYKAAVTSASGKVAFFALQAFLSSDKSLIEQIKADIAGETKERPAGRYNAQKTSVSMAKALVPNAQLTGQIAGYTIEAILNVDADNDELPFSVKTIYDKLRKEVKAEGEQASSERAAIELALEHFASGLTVEDVLKQPQTVKGLYIQKGQELARVLANPVSKLMAEYEKLTDSEKTQFWQELQSKRKAA